MKLINGFDLMSYAQRRKLVLPAFNTTNMEMTFAIVKGLNAAKLPGYVQISSNNLRLSDPDTIAYLTRRAQENNDTPIGLHLDHGKSYEDVCACVKAGFTSIMIDASHLPFEENIAEVGSIGGKEDDLVSEADAKTDPNMVADFVERTGCDTLAVAVGNVHGIDAVPHIDLPLLKKIAEISPVPLVLHGGSGISFDIIHEARKYNLIKINYGADLRRVFVATYGKAYEKNHKENQIISISLQAVDEVARVTKNLVQKINE